MVFTALNGFALVFAVAAIVAVTLGPALLVWHDPRGPWRNKVVRVGLFHLCLSLVAFTGAFAASGFVTALVNPPLTSCGLIKCSEGGVPCSADQQIPFDVDCWTKNSLTLHTVLMKELVRGIWTRSCSV